MKLDDLEALSRKCVLDRGVWEWSLATPVNEPFIIAANPATILEMIELIRMMKEALDEAQGLSAMTTYPIISEALAAVERWEKGE